MIPDTSVYMIAGFVVILGGILIYMISILIRYNQAKHQAALYYTIDLNRSKDSTTIKDQNEI